MRKENIGMNAGKIWHLLERKGTLNIREIGEHTHLDESNIYLTLGWLSRENKIQFIEEKGKMKIGLNHQFSEMYY